MSAVDMMPLARRAWTAYEPVHAVVYFAPEAREEFDAAGLRGGWMGYFASRSAAMGRVTAPLVVATFHNFQPEMVRRAIPDAWTFATPERVLDARLRAADRALRRLWAGAVDTPEVREAAALALRAVESLHHGGRPLAAAHAALPVPEAPHLRLWHACTVLREHRFDGHVAALTAHGLDGLDALVTAAIAGGLNAATIRRFRGWSEAEWDAAVRRLREGGLLDEDGTLSDRGRELRRLVEDLTDRLAAPVWDAMPADERDRLLGLLRDLALRVQGEGGLVYPNPIGVPSPV